VRSDGVPSRREVLSLGVASLASGALPGVPSLNGPAAAGALAVLDVRQFGAVGDGRTDDRAAVVAATQEAAGRKGPIVVYFPPGIYLIGDGPPPALANGVVALGAGPASVLRRGPRTTYFAILVNADYAQNAQGNTDITVADLSFDGNGPEQSPPFNEWKHAVALIGVTRAVIRDCRFTNLSGDGVYVGSTIDGTARPNACHDIHIRGNYFDGQRAGRNGVSIIDAQGVSIIGNTFVAVAGARSPGGIDLEPDRASEGVDNVAIVGNAFRDCREAIQAYGGNTHRTGSLSIVGNVIDTTRAGGAGIGLLEWVDAVVVGNNISGTVGPGIALSGSTTVSIQANDIRATGASGVSLRACSGFALTGNTVHDCAGEAFRLEDCRVGLLSGNHARAWDKAGSGDGPAISGLGASEDVLVTGNVLDKAAQAGPVVRTRGRCNGWHIHANLFRVSGKAVDLVGQNDVSGNG
jgi:polygalacturonase